MNSAPPDFRIERDLPPGFSAFFARLHAEFTPRQWLRDLQSDGSRDRPGDGLTGWARSV